MVDQRRAPLRIDMAGVVGVVSVALLLLAAAASTANPQQINFSPLLLLLCKFSISCGFCRRPRTDAVRVTNVTVVG